MEKSENYLVQFFSINIHAAPQMFYNDSLLHSLSYSSSANVSRDCSLRRFVPREDEVAIKGGSEPQLETNAKVTLVEIARPPS